MIISSSHINAVELIPFIKNINSYVIMHPLRNSIINLSAIMKALLQYHKLTGHLYSFIVLEKALK